MAVNTAGVDAEVLVVGGGAIGGVTAAKLHGHVRRLAVLDADREHVARLREPGLRIDDLGSELVLPLDASDRPDDLDGPFDFALLTLKGIYLPTVLPELASRELARCYVSLGNGLVQDRVAELVGAERVIAGIVEWGATNLGPGEVTRTTSGPFVVGELGGLVRDRTRVLADVLGGVTDVEVTTNITGHVWSKLLINATFSGLGAVCGRLYREVVAEPPGREAAYRLWEEGLAVAAAHGVRLEPVIGVDPQELAPRRVGSAAADRALDQVMDRVGATKSSMLQDLERGAPTEVDLINGAVVDRGAAADVPTPLHARVVEAIHGAEHGEARPSPDLLKAILHP